MKKIFLLLLFGLFGIAAFSAQTIIRGKVVDENGEELIGSTVLIKGTTIGTMTDLSGNYSIQIADTSEQTVVFSYISYKTVEKRIDPRGKKTIILNVSLKAESIELEGAVVIYKFSRETDDYVVSKARNAPTSMGYISKETIKKTGDSQVDDAMKRITGVSSVGGYISVRGLADRYIKTTINGSIIPTLDPLKNNIKLDMIPTSLIDNIMITKTLTPDLPGDWAGSFVSVQTKDYPDKLMVNFKTSFVYNPNSSFTTINTSEASSTDWLGFDDSYRDVDHSTFVRYNTKGLSAYDVFVELGYGEYMQNLGITSTDIFESNVDYYNLLLVQTGYLAPAYIDNNLEVEKAKEAFTQSTEYTSNLEKLNTEYNASAKSFGTSLPNNWFPVQEKNYLDYSQDLSFGNQFTLFKKTFGYVVGLRYAKQTNYDADIEREEIFFSEIDSLLGTYRTRREYSRVQTEQIYQWGGLINISCKLNPYNSFSLMFMPNFIGENKTKSDVGYDYISSEFDTLVYINRQSYVERRMLVYQFQSTHIIPESLIEIECNVSYADGLNSEPDTKKLRYGLQNIEGVEYLKFDYNDSPSRSYNYLDENILDSRLDVEIPILRKPGLVRKIKTGAAHRYYYRDVRQYEYVLNGEEIQTAGNLLTEEEFKDIFSEENTSAGNAYYVNDTMAYNFARGEQTVSAGYAMLDFNMNKKLRFSGGLRVEYSKLYSDLIEFYEQGIPNNVSGRRLQNGGLNTLANETNRDEINYLPSLNLIYKLFTGKKLAIVSRGSISRSLVRPGIREVSVYRNTDFTLEGYLSGDPELNNAYVDNYDLRIETYFENKDNFAFSYFYKKIDGHIELIYNSIIRSFTWENASGIGTVYGFELEGKKNITKNIDFLGNLTIMKSEVTLVEGILRDTVTRPLYGQSPYVVNLTLSYTSQKIGFSTSLSYNVQGEKLAYVTLGVNQPDLYEQPRHRFDFKVSQKLGKYFRLELKIRDVLDTRTRWAYDADNVDVYERDYSYGTDYSISLSYDL